MLKTVKELELLSAQELTAYMQTLTESDRKQVQAEFYLAAVRHFRKPDHTYENSGFKMSEDQYHQLEATILLNAQPEPPMNRKQRRAMKSLAK